MKILVVCQHYWPENFRVTEICEALAAKGHDVTALVGLPNYPSGIIPAEYKRFRNRKQERNGVHIRRCFEIGRKSSKIGLAINYVSYMTSATLKALLMKKDFDVIYSFSTSPVLMSMPGAILKLFTRIPFVIYVLDIWPACLTAMKIPENSWFYRMMKHISKWIYKRADVLLYSSIMFQEYMETVHHISMPDEHYMPQFADGLFEEALPEKPASDKTNLVFAGNIGAMQNVQVFVKAAALLKAEPIHWHIVGDGTDLEKCRQLAKELDVEDHVTFYGSRPLEEMPAFYAMADALLVSMRMDEYFNKTLPGKVQSYMAVGKPILASNAGETPYVIDHVGCGYCARPDDPEAFAAIVRKFMAEPEKHQEKGEKGKAYYEAHFTKHTHMDKLEELLQTLAEKRMNG